MLKRAIAYSLAGYCVLLLGLCLYLSHYDWPSAPELEEAVEPLVEEILDPSPPDFKAIRDTSARKEAFFGFLLPLIEQENQRILKKREQLLAINERAKTGKLTGKDLERITAWMERYAVEEGPLEQTLDRLDRRINTLPPALVLAQAASESAWGTSRFAREGNNYFGQWCFKAGCGLVPKRRMEGAYHEVTRFNSARESVAAYFHNINTHSAYHGLRLLRQEKAARGETFSGYELAGKLTSYSERGAPYIEELRSIMRGNQLESGWTEPTTSIENQVLSMKEEELGIDAEPNGSDEH
jgi:Bax protein